MRGVIGKHVGGLLHRSLFYLAKEPDSRCVVQIGVKQCVCGMYMGFHCLGGCIILQRWEKGNTWGFGA